MVSISVSSSPVNAIIKSLLGVYPSFFSLIKADVRRVVPDLSSAVPRPKKYPSSSINLKGSLIQSFFNASTTSMCATNRIGSLPELLSPRYLTIIEAISSPFGDVKGSILISSSAKPPSLNLSAK